MPFGEYEDWDDCIAKNQDKDDPEAYCGVVKRAIEEGIIPAIPPPTPPTNLNLEEYLDYQLIKNRTVIFHGEVYESTAKAASKRLEYLAAISKEPIHVILNSVGGAVYDGLLIFETIKDIVDKGISVICEARGLAASMGSLIMQAGTKRVATPHTRFLIHEVASFQWGETSRLEERTEELRKLNDMLNGIYAERTGKSVEEINELTKKRDYWMSAEEAKEFGLIDEIKESPKTLMESLGIVAISKELGKESGKELETPKMIYLDGETPKLEPIEKEERFKIHGEAIHPITTFHPTEHPMVRKYLEEELEKAAPSLAGKPLNIDHNPSLRLPEGNEIVKTWWNPETKAVAYEGFVTKEVAEKIKNGEYSGLSVAVNIAKPGAGIKFVNGFAPFGFEFVHMSLLKDMKPGDPEAYIEILEAVMKEAIEQQQMIRYSVAAPDQFLDNTYSVRWIDEQNGIEGLYAEKKEPPHDIGLVSIFFMKGKTWDDTKKDAWLQEHQELLPKPEGIQTFQDERPPADWWDSCTGKAASFADDPDSFCGWLWYHGPEAMRGGFGEAFLTGEQVEILKEAFTRWQEQQEPIQEPTIQTDEHGCKVGAEVWDEEQGACVPLPPKPPEPAQTATPTIEESVELVQLRKQVVAMKDAVAQAEKREKTAKTELEKFRERINALIPPQYILNAWGYAHGATRTIQAILKVIRDYGGK